MAFLEKVLRVKKSTLPDAGKGLFTTVPIVKGQRIAEYKGKKMTWAQAERLSDERNGYVFYFNRNHVIDAWKTRKGIAHYANDARGIARTKGINNNSEYVTVGHRCFIDATRDIEKGEEILVGYGAEYWQAIRYNLREELKEKRKKKGRNRVGDLSTEIRKGKVSLPHQLARRKARK
jgi:uncharacterized protein